MGDSENSGAVLVVEDEPMIRIMATDHLQEAGFEVHEAARADEAIPILEAHSEIRLLFTDVKMPGSMDGLKLAQYVQRRWPGVKIIVTSGHVRVTQDGLPSGALFLPKPYDIAMLPGRIKQMIAA